jgi:hypothetical protein
LEYSRFAMPCGWRGERYRLDPMTASVDSSARFVLPADSPWLANLPALWAADPQLAMAIEALEGEPSYPTEDSRSGEPTMSVTSPDGRRLWLHSRHRPREEAHRLIQHVDFENNLFFHLHGLGLGYQLELLFHRAGGEAVYCIFEPDLLLLRTTLQTRDLSKMIASRRVLFFTRLDKGEVFTRLNSHTPLITLGTTDVDHPPSIQRHPDFHKQTKAWLAEFASFGRTNINTLVLNGRRTLENIARNLGWYTATPGIDRLEGLYAGKPAVIVSAGPSLRKNKHRLKEMVGHVVIIAVQTTLQPLLEIGIEPDFVTSLDYHEICARFFEKLPKMLRTELVAEPKATTEIFRLNPGPVTVLGNEWAESLLREMDLNKGKLTAGSTVAHLAYYVAEHLKCDPIIFVGQDLGFSDGLYYSPGTSYDDVWRPEFGRFCTPEMKQWEQIVRERPILRKIPDHAARPMYTEERLFTYLQQFERDFSSSKAKIIDATEGGAAKLGTTVMPLAEAASQFCREPLPVVDHSANDPDWARVKDCIASLENRRGEASTIKSIGRETLPLLEELRDHVEDQPRVNRLIARIDQLRNKMNEHGETYDLVMQMTQATEMQRFLADRKIAAKKLRGVDLQREQVSRDIDNVRGVMQAAADFVALMDEVIGQIRMTKFEFRHSNFRDGAANG